MVADATDPYLVPYWYNDRFAVQYLHTWTQAYFWDSPVTRTGHTSTVQNTACMWPKTTASRTATDILLG